ncbi:predicted protein [Botrytis cinerea T4]|uniref:Uncharacterized protein n=1 Tax=Botryotinia fuckeliana (strain T4) TaxID=999810 RepID=G2YS35_BOTF4|nr:predicted protein [Botrytis cinerea T4]
MAGEGMVVKNKSWPRTCVDGHNLSTFILNMSRFAKCRHASGHISTEYNFSGRSVSRSNTGGSPIYSNIPLNSYTPWNNTETPLLHKHYSSAPFSFHLVRRPSPKSPVKTGFREARFQQTLFHVPSGFSFLSRHLYTLQPRKEFTTLDEINRWSLETCAVSINISIRMRKDWISV